MTYQSLLSYGEVKLELCDTLLEVYGHQCSTYILPSKLCECGLSITTLRCRYYQIWASTLRLVCLRICTNRYRACTRNFRSPVRIQCRFTHAQHRPPNLNVWPTLARTKFEMFTHGQIEGTNGPLVNAIGDRRAAERTASSPRAILIVQHATYEDS